MAAAGAHAVASTPRFYFLLHPGCWRRRITFALTIAGMPVPEKERPEDGSWSRYTAGSRVKYGPPGAARAGIPSGTVGFDYSVQIRSVGSIGGSLNQVEGVPIQGEIAEGRRSA